MGYLSLDFLLSLCSVLRAAIVDIIIQRARYRNTHRGSFPRARLDTPSSVCSHMEGGHENLQSDTTSTQCARQREEEEEKQKNNNEIPLGPNSLFSSCCDRRDELVDCLKLEMNRLNIIAGLSLFPRPFWSYALLAL